MGKIASRTNWVLWCFIVFCTFSPVWNHDDRVRSSTRKEKLEELLRVLNNYQKPTEEETKSLKSTKNNSSIMAPVAIEYDVITSLPLSDDVDDVSKETAQLPSSVSSYEDFYRIFYGTKEGVNHLKKHYGPEGLQRARAKLTSGRKDIESVRKANEHFLQIRTRARCKTPVPKLVRVKDYYPDPSREYLPRCTLLHRCGETAGCCDSDAYHCVPRSSQKVALHFYKLTVGKNGLGYPANRDHIERLTFVNHTSCHCQPINDLPRIVSVDHRLFPRDGMAPKGGDKTHSTSYHSRHRRRHQHEALNNRKCRECPVPFNSRTYRDGRCGCDCFDRQKPCLKIKRGKQPLNEIELRCVESNFCHPPDCEHGVFDVATGFCPKRHDEAPRDHEKRSHNTHDRWALLERD